MPTTQPQQQTHSTEALQEIREKAVAADGNAREAERRLLDRGKQISAMQDDLAKKQRELLELQEKLAAKQGEQDRDQEVFSGESLRATTFYGMLDIFCRDRKVDYPVDPAPLDLGAANYCVHPTCGMQVRPDEQSRMWVHVATGRPECAPGEQLSTHAAPRPRNDDQAPGAQENGQQPAAGPAKAPGGRS